jgi:methylmalonyl-CoA mutase
MEVAKLRAARLLWAKAVAAFGGSRLSQKMTIHVRTSAWNKTIFDPYVNMLRATVEGFAGSIGGADSIHIGPFDEPLGLPDAFSRRIARNSHLILQHESHLNKVIDPAGGSWYVETLTDAIARQAWALFQQVERMGGMGQALLAGFPQAQIAQTAAQRTGNIATRRDVFVGTNMFANLTENPSEVHQIDYEDLHKRRANHIVQHRTSLDNLSNTIVLQKLVEVLNAELDNAIEAAIEAALAGATLGEIAKTLRTGDEIPTTIEPITPYRATETFESIRVASEIFRARTGSRPQVFLANMGPVSQHKARADFTVDFFQVGGFELVNNDGFSTVRLAARAAIETDAPVIVICSTDETYPTIVPRLTRTIKRAEPKRIVIVAGRPGEQRELYQKAGVDDFIHLGVNVYDKLFSLQHRLGII